MFSRLELHRRFIAVLLISCCSLFGYSDLNAEVIFPQIVKFPKPIRGIDRKVGCLWQSYNKVVPVLLKGDKAKRVLRKKDIVGVRNKKGKKVSISYFKVTCRRQTSPRSSRQTTSTPVPTETPTPTNNPHSVLPSGCLGSEHGCTRIINYSREARPGEVVNIFGGRFNDVSKPIIQQIGRDGKPIVGSREILNTILKDDGLIQVRIPVSFLSKELFALWIDTNGVTSEPIFINKPVVQMISEEKIRIGGAIKVWGRGLSLSDHDLSLTKVYFRRDSSFIPANIREGNTLELEIDVPQGLVEGESYELVISNGLGGTLGYLQYGKPLLVLPSSTDPLRLGVAWASEVDMLQKVYDAKSDTRLPLRAIGNGIVDDTSALQQSLDYIGVNGGGVLYLPIGTYKITSALQLKHSKVLLSGQSKSQTVIRYGEENNRNSYFLSFAEENIKYSGISNLKIENMHTERSINRTILNWYKSGIEKIFILDVDLQAGLGMGPSFEDISDIVIRRTNINQTVNWNESGRVDGPIHFHHVKNLTFTENTINYKIGRPHFTTLKRAVVMNNSFTMDGSSSNLQALIDDRAVSGNANEVGGPELGFSTDMVVAGNVISVTPIPNLTNPIIKEFMNLSYEMLMTQTSIYNFTYMGNVTGVNGNKIYDSSKNWSQGLLIAPLRQQAILSITHGPGLGQSRKITGGVGSEIILDSPFEIPPVAGESAYTIHYWVNDNLVLLDNTIIGGHSAVVIYNSGNDISILRNYVSDSGTIYVHGRDLDPDGSFNYQRYLSWNILVNDNVSVNNNGNWGANIRIATYQHLNQVLHGNSVLNVEVKSNSLFAKTSNTPPYAWADYDGIYHFVVGGAGHDTTGQSAFLGPLKSIYGLIAINNRSENFNMIGNKPIYKTVGLFGYVEEGSVRTQ